MVNKKNMNELSLKEKLKKNNINFNGKILLMHKTGSTNTDASFLAQKGEEALIIADIQTNGRGRFDRTFISDEGGLYFSLIVKTNKEPIEIMDYPIRVGRAVKKAIDELYGVDCEIKEPNDVLLEKKKICGILMESIPRDEELYVITGVGLNVCNKLPACLPDAATLKQLTAKEIDKEDILCGVVKEIIKIF